ncbi:MAG: M23 family metallopeptidase, partial [bacterium]|nr:M23 family metallopeptidase [bacterium]
DPSPGEPEEPGEEAPPSGETGVPGVSVPEENRPLHENVYVNIPTINAWPDISLLPADGVVSKVWSNPAMGALTSPFGMRVHPIFGAYMNHSGTDIAAACGTPVVAAADGVVVFVGTNFQYRTGNQVVLSHGDGVITRYGHLLTGATELQVGDLVKVGEPIGAVGGDRRIDPVGAGNSTGCHLHFEVNLDLGAKPIDAVQFFTALNIRLGLDELVVPAEEPAEEVVEPLPVVEVRTPEVDYLPGVAPELRIRPLPVG